MSSSARYLATCVLLCTGLHPAAATARTWTVRADSTGDAPTIQAALDSAVSGDDVLVTPGTYTWTNQGMGSSVSGPSMLDVGYGVRPHSESGASQTVLDAQGQGRVSICRFCDGIARTRGFGSAVVEPREVVVALRRRLRQVARSPARWRGQSPAPS